MTCKLWLNAGILLVSTRVSEKQYQFRGDSILYQNGRWFVAFGSGDNPVPNDLKQFVEEVSVHEHVSVFPGRERGIYRHESAVAEVQKSLDGNLYEIRTRAKNLEDALNLIHMIKVGTIRPEESYEGPQLGKSRQELEAELATAQETAELLGVELSAKINEIAGMASEFKMYQESFFSEHKKANRLEFELGEFAFSLFSGFWPLCFKKTISDRINTIIGTPIGK